MEFRFPELVRRVWRAPRDHGAAVIVPAWSELRAVWQDNCARFATWNTSPFGLSWGDWRAACRRESLEAAYEYTSNVLGAELPEPRNGPLFVDGHQPELFHPGVWAKNFAIDRLARDHAGTALHLIVDQDVSAKSGILAPCGPSRQPSTTLIPYDAPRAQQPWETTVVRDQKLFRSFADRVQQHLQEWNIDPVVSLAWPAAIEQAERGTGLVTALTAARVSIERRWGLRNLELPLSHVCKLPSFWRFVAAILFDIPAFSRQHNAVLQEYRRLNRIRSRAHPVPELSRDGEWWEAPFWVTRTGDAQRDRLWVRRERAQFTLRNMHQELISWRESATDAFAPALQAFEQLSSQGWRVQSRALTTTLYARLGLADLFVHGLGGAKYDEMTDALMLRCFGVQPPAFLTVSATFHLPLANYGPQQFAAIGELRQRRRDLLQNPQRYLAEQTDPSVRRLLAQRQDCLTALHGAESASTLVTRGDRRRAYLQMQEINRELAQALAPRLDEIDQLISDRDRHLAARRVLGSREYSWTLFPAEMLRTSLPALFEPPPYNESAKSDA